MCVGAKLLPPARIQYKDRTSDPGLKGQWNVNGHFAHPPKNPMPQGVEGPGYLIASVYSSGRSADHGTKDLNKTFIASVCKEALNLGIRLTPGGETIDWDGRDMGSLGAIMSKMQQCGVRLVIVLLEVDSYQTVKFVGDNLGLVTQCVKYKNVRSPPRGYAVNLMLKINTKLGGTNHTLASRMSTMSNASAVASFQNPPESISWVFNKPCMLIGIDISHPEADKRETGKSIAAVVGSMDGWGGQYVAQLSTKVGKTDIMAADSEAGPGQLNDTGLTECMQDLLKTFRKRNNTWPEHLIIYRDGVSEGQFSDLLQKELSQIHEAIALVGGIDMKICYVVCTKRHNNRLFFSDGSENAVAANVCAGLCIDKNAGQNSIVSSTLHEFYLNSHATIQGTAKSCRYTMLYDEIGLRMSELELLTYWTTYLYPRCNRSVSLAAPAYLAHWAGKREVLHLRDTYL